MFGIAHIHTPGVNVNSSDPQDIDTLAENTFRYATSHGIPVELHGLKASTTDIGPLTIEGLHVYGASIVGMCPAVGATVSVGEGKITFTT